MCAEILLMKNIVFLEKENVMVVQVLLYGVEVWGETVSLSTCNEIGKFEKMFLCRELGVKYSKSNSIIVLEIGA